MLRRIFSHIAIALLAGACLYGAERSAVWLDVPFIKQEKRGCGAASIAMVMQYWQQQQGQPVSPFADSVQILHALRADTTHEIYASDVERYFRQNGYRTFAFSGEWALLKQQLGKGRPLIAALKPTSDRELHYVGVAGL